jgi:branched-chain amino acid transport system substrate-binding protein
VTNALRQNVTLDTIYGKVALRAADNQLVLPNYVGRVKTVDGALRQVVEQTFDASLTPPASPLCKM